MEHQKELFHNFIDLKKAFDRVWHDGLWRGLKEYNIDNRLIEVIRSLYDEATSTALLNGSVRDFLRTTVEVRKDVHYLQYYFHGKDNAEDFDTSSSIGGRPVWNMRFADDIDLLGDSEEKLQQLTERRKKSALQKATLN